MEWRIASPFSVVYSLYWSHLILNLVIKLHLYRQSFGPLNSSETAYIPKAEITSFESDLSLPALPSVNRSLWNYAHLSVSTLFHHEHNWFWPFEALTLSLHRCCWPAEQLHIFCYEMSCICKILHLHLSCSPRIYRCLSPITIPNVHLPAANWLYHLKVVSFHINVDNIHLSTSPTF